MRVLIFLFLLSFSAFGQISYYPIYIGDLQTAFWKSTTVVDRWAKGGTAIIPPPNYLLDSNNLTFYYKKRSYQSEILFTEHVHIVRSLGGWNPNWNGGEMNSFTNYKDADIIYKNANNQIQYRLHLLKDRILPYYNAGYIKNLTLVFDNFPYHLSQADSITTYGECMPPDNITEWNNMVSTMCDSLSYWFGSNNVKDWKFRLGTEWGKKPRFYGTTQDYIALYKNSGNIFKSKFGSQIDFGPYNSGSDKNNPTLADVNIFEVLKTAKDSSLPITYAPVSNYSIPKIVNGKYNNTSPQESVNRLVTYWQKVDSVYGMPLKKEIHELGILSDEFDNSTNEPGIRGAAWEFDVLFSLWEKGLSNSMHWDVGEENTIYSNQNFILNGRGWLYSVLEHMKGAKTYTYPIPVIDSLSSKIIVFENDSLLYVLASAFHPNRHKTTNSIFSIEMPIPKTAVDTTFQILYQNVNDSNFIYTKIYQDLLTSNNLKPAYIHNPPLLASIKDMAINYTNAKIMINNNFTSYSSKIKQSLKLEPSPYKLSSTNTLAFLLKPAEIKVFCIRKKSSLTNSVNEENKEESEIKIFPNPTSEFIQIKAHEKIEKIILHDINGKRLALASNIHDTEATVLTKNLAPGFYLLNIIFKDKEIAKKILVK